MRVRATNLGYYAAKRRRAGDVFELEDKKHFSKNWMEDIDGELKKPEKTEKPEKTGK